MGQHAQNGVRAALEAVFLRPANASSISFFASAPAERRADAVGQTSARSNKAAQERNGFVGIIYQGRQFRLHQVR